MTGSIFVLMVVLIYSGDLHGQYRPGLAMRGAIGIPMLGFAAFVAWAMSTIEGHAFIVGRSTADLVVECRHRVGGANETVGFQSYMVSLQFILAIAVIMVTQQERNIVLLSIGDRIMEALADL